MSESNPILAPSELATLDRLSRAARKTILAMVGSAQSGHPGGSLSSLDFLALLLSQRLINTKEPLVISNGHISPAVYALWAELGAVDKQKLITEFRQFGSIFEGHVTRHVAGIDYGTGPLGVGVSAAVGFAQDQKLRGKSDYTFFVMGDGEAQEGQVHEAALYAAKESLGNLIGFCDANGVQLTDSLKKIAPLDIPEIFRAHGWQVLEADGHDYQKLWQAIFSAEKSERPSLIVGRTIMGYGVRSMMTEGEAHRATWHGKAPSGEQVEQFSAEIPWTDQDQADYSAWQRQVKFSPRKNETPPFLSELKTVSIGTQREYSITEKKDIRSAYGQALLDLAQLNEGVLAATADLRSSVMTKLVAAEKPAQHLEFGICEQNMVTTCGALSLRGWIPFCSTFGAFMTSRAKDQARVNDLNQTNVKMVATHCGLSVGEDGPTHQAIDDLGSFLGFFNTAVLEPSDANHGDRLTRFMAAHYGNFYMRMGRHKLPILTKADGTALYGADYEYYWGRCDVLQEGSEVTVITAGSVVEEALAAVQKSKISAEILIPSTPQQFDETFLRSVQKTKRVLVVEDHNSANGWGSSVSRYLLESGVALKKFQALGVAEYQLSGKPAELYASAGVGEQAVGEVLKELV